MAGEVSSVGTSGSVHGSVATSPALVEATAVIKDYTARDVKAMRGRGDKLEGQLPDGRWVALDARGNPILPKHSTDVSPSSLGVRPAPSFEQTANRQIEEFKAKHPEVTVETTFSSGQSWMSYRLTAKDANSGTISGGAGTGNAGDLCRIMEEKLDNMKAQANKPVVVSQPADEAPANEYIDLDISIGREYFGGGRGELWVTSSSIKDQLTGLTSASNALVTFEAVPKMNDDDEPMAEVRNTVVAEKGRDVGNEDTSVYQPTAYISVRLTDGAVFNKGMVPIEVEGKIGRVNAETLTLLRSEIKRQQPDYATYWEDDR